MYDILQTNEQPQKKHQAFGQQTVQQKLINFYIHLINNCLSITSSTYEVTESYNIKLKKIYLIKFTYPQKLFQH